MRLAFENNEKINVIFLYNIQILGTNIRIPTKNVRKISIFATTVACCQFKLESL
jgi:hypothetical protein